MASVIRLAGFTLTVDEWEGLDTETRDQLLPLDAVTDEEDRLEDDTGVVW